MNLISLSFLLLLLCLSAIVTGQERAPHGLAYETPEAFPPSAYTFFHPNNIATTKPETKEPCNSNTNSASKCSSSLPLAAQVEEEATQIHETKGSKLDKSNKKLGAGGVAGIIIGVAFVVALAMTVYHVRLTRRANMSKANNTSVQLHV